LEREIKKSLEGGDSDLKKIPSVVVEGCKSGTGEELLIIGETMYFFFLLF